MPLRDLAFQLCFVGGFGECATETNCNVGVRYWASCEVPSPHGANESDQITMITRPTNWLNEMNSARTLELAARVTDIWKAGPDPRAYTPHDPGHFERVEHNLRCLIPPESWTLLTENERFLLTCAAWTHDVAMHPDAHGPSGRTLSPQQIRDLHVDESANWIIRERRRLNLSFSEAVVIAEINRYHSRRNALTNCSVTRVCKGECVRPQLLAAYLRLADAIEVAHERVDDWELSRFLFLQEAVTEGTDHTLFHWIKSFMVAGIVPSPKNQSLLVEFQAPKHELIDMLKRTLNEREVREFAARSSIPLNAAENASGFRLLTEYILDELRNELETVERVLASGGITSFHFVDSSNEVILLDGVAKPVWATGLSRVVNYMQVAYSPNSTGTADAALTAVDDAIEVIEQRSKSAEERNAGTATSSSKSKKTLRVIPREIAEEILHQLRESLQARLQIRSCQNELRRITQFVVNLAAHMIKQRHDNCRPWLLELQHYRRRMGDLIASDKGAAKRLSENFWSAAKDRLGGPSETKRLTVLLFGNSSTVAKTLAKFTENGCKHLYCYIAEGRPKTHHGARNVPLYVDAETYARAIREAVSKHTGDFTIDIRVIPDVVVGTVLDSFHAQDRDRAKHPPVDIVLFGANSIFCNDEEVRVAHTSGHLAIAATAKQFNVPVYVLAGAVKVHSQSPAQKWRNAERPKNAWLASDGSGLIERLRKQGATADWNPREDQIPLSLLTAIITEEGICENNANLQQTLDQLKQWESKIDNLLGQDLSFTRLPSSNGHQSVLKKQSPPKGMPATAQLNDGKGC